MSTLSFESDVKSSELKSLDLPVEIRKSNLYLEAQCLISQPVTVKPGTYHVTAKLPAGQELYGQVEIAEGESKIVTLKLDPADESPRETEEEQRFLWGKTGYESASRGLGGLGGGGDETTAKLKAFKGNILQGSYEPVEGNDWLKKVDRPQPPGVYECDLNTGDPGLAGSTLVQLVQSGLPPVNMAVPPREQQAWQIILSLQPDEHYSIDVHLEHKTADTLLRYSERGMLEQVAKMATSQALELLYHKLYNPIAAVAGAYVFLRLGAVDEPGSRPSNWLENLKNGFTWLPDGLPIYGEHLARLGQHSQALATFLELPERGLPLFSDGLSYTVNRLRLYIGSGEKHFEKDDLARAATLLEQLQRFTPYVDFQRTVLSFTGSDPGKPDNRPLEDFELEDYEGLDWREIASTRTM
jgi:hypothetical protein